MVTLHDTLRAAGWVQVMRSSGWGVMTTVYVRGLDSCVVLDHNSQLNARDEAWRALPPDARGTVLYLEPPPKARAWALTPL